MKAIKSTGLRQTLLWGGVSIVVAAGASPVINNIADTENLRVRIIEALEQQSGYHLRAGDVQISVLPYPNVEMRHVSFANMKNGREHKVLTAERVDGRISIWPLLRHNIRVKKLIMTKATLDSDNELQDSIRNVASSLKIAGKKKVTRPHGGERWRISFHDVFINQPQISFYQTADKTSEPVRLTHAALLDMDQENPRIIIEAQKGDQGLYIQGNTGPLAALQKPAAPDQASWPLKFVVSGWKGRLKTAEININGQVEDPYLWQGYDLYAQGKITAPKVFSAWLPWMLIPDSVREISFRSGIVGSGMSPSLRVLHARAEGARGTGGAQASFLQLDSNNPSDLIKITGFARGLEIKGNSGRLKVVSDSLFNNFTPAVPVNLKLSSPRNRLHIAGQFSHAQGGELNVELQAQKASDILAMAGASVSGYPAFLSNIKLQGRADIPDLRHLALYKMRFSSDQGDMSGSVQLHLPATREQPASVLASLASERLDLDRLGRPPGASDSSPAPAGVPPHKEQRWAWLGRLNGTLSLRVKEVLFRGSNYHDLALKLRAEGGAITLDPFLFTNAANAPSVLSAQLKPVGEALGIEASMRPFHLPAQWAGLALGAPAVAAGDIVLAGSVYSQGSTLADFRQNLRGTLGVSTSAIRMDSAAIAPLLRHFNIAASTKAGKDIALRCLALRADIQPDHITMDKIHLALPKVLITGQGRVNRADRGLDFNLLTRAALGRADVATTLHVSGKVDAPVVTVTPASSPAGGGRKRYALTITPSGRGSGTPMPESGCPSALSVSR